MDGLSNRATDTIAGTLAGLGAFLVLLVVYINAGSPVEMTGRFVFLLFLVSIGLLIAGGTMISFAYSRDSCVKVS